MKYFAASLMLSAQTAIGLNLSSEMIIRDDVADSVYQGNPADYPAFFAYPKNMASGMNCAATLVSTRFAITAAHCFLDEETTQPPFTVTIGGNDYRVEEVRNNDCYSPPGDFLRNGGDIALMRLEEPVTGVTPVDIWDADTNADGNEEGQQIKLLGYGDTGKAGVDQDDTRADATFRVGTNVVTSIKNNMLQYKFDGPGSNQLATEAMSWSGDSGGPALINGKIAGVNSNGDCCDYGSIDQYTRLGGNALQWIRDNIAAEGRGEGIPVPTDQCTDANYGERECKDNAGSTCEDELDAQGSGSDDDESPSGSGSDEDSPSGSGSGSDEDSPSGSGSGSGDDSPSGSGSGSGDDECCDTYSCWTCSESDSFDGSGSGSGSGNDSGSGSGDECCDTVSCWTCESDSDSDW